MKYLFANDSTGSDRREEKLLNRSIVAPKKTYKYMVGDLVRIIKKRLTFARGYLPNWSEEIFIVYNKKNFKEPFYYLRDFNDEDIKGGLTKKSYSWCKIAASIESKKCFAESA